MLAVASAIARVLAFEGFRTGLYQEIRAFPEALPTDLIAMQPGVSNLLGAPSVLPGKRYTRPSQADECGTLPPYRGRPA